ncbi:MAG: DUF4214 domain-containing protein [Acidimicrobiales bacterium]|nr:DUF4214 domain-containing protein [Acidimicrobiales bacterium]
MRRTIAAAVAVATLLVGPAVTGAAAAPSGPRSAPPTAKYCAPDEGSVARLYQAFFFRAPDWDGFWYWMGVYDRGVPLGQIADGFTYSAEFLSTYGGLSNEDFVWLVYLNVLGRDPDPGGYGYWVDQLYRGLPWGWMMVEFSESPEFVGFAGPCPGIDTGWSLGDLMDACAYGDMLACDYVYWVTPSGSEAEYYGMTCGYRVDPDAGYCVYRFGRWW